MALAKLILKCLLFFSISTLCLCACTPFVYYPHSDIASKQTAVTATAGAGTGAIISSATSGVASSGLGIGALAGAAVGMYYNSPSRWLKQLQKDGITVIQTGQIVKIVIPSDKIFILNTDSILPSSYPILSDVTHFIQNYGVIYITVNGYTDNVGSALSDYKLSAAQAKSVMAFLWSHGIPSTHLKAIGHGQANPIAANYTVVGAAYNRRIEVNFAFG